MLSVIQNYSGGEIIDYQQFDFGSLPEFVPIRAKTGFGNAILENDEVGTLKRFSVYEKVSGKIEYHFAVAVALEFDSATAKSFVNKNPKVIDVNYKSGKRKFRQYLATDILSNKTKKTDMADQIVLIGVLAPGTEDKFFTPLNSNRNEPDMYGLEYLANVVAQILEYKTNKFR
jgi:CHASE2 domain-containing sensor protein